MKIFIEIFLTQERTRGHEVTLVKDQCRLEVLVLTQDNK